MRIAPATALGLALLALACSDDPSSPAMDRGDVFAASSQTTAACAANPTIVVGTEADLHAAVGSGSPGDVIAVSGTLALVQDVFIERPGVTITCAAPGDGLRFAPANPRRWGLIEVYAPDATITGLALDGRTGSYALYAIRQNHVVFTNNTIQCGGGCGFFVGTTNAVVTGNTATTALSSTGLHFQELIDGSIIERNTVIATTSVGSPLFGGIRPRDGVDVRVSDNVVLGPWSNSISMVNVSSSEVMRNRLEGARAYGLVFNIAGSLNVAFARDNIVRANRITGAAGAGYLLRNACSNEFTGNPVLRGSGVAAILDISTGDNFVAGSPGTMIDNGAYDCDGDGIDDPNTVHGAVVQGSVVAVDMAVGPLRQRLFGSSSGIIPLM